MILYNYFRSSASFRVRIALHLKGIPFEYRPIHLLNGNNKTEEFLRVNPLGQVPALITPHGPLTQSTAIIEYLDAIVPEPPLFPQDPWQRAKVQEIVQLINSGIQPLVNIGVLNELPKEKRKEWVLIWLKKGFKAIESLLPKTGDYCVGAHLTAADIFLVPQVFMSERFDLNLLDYPRIKHIAERLNQLDAVIKAHPTRQIDFE